MAHVVLYEANYNRGKLSFDTIRTIPTTEKEINRQLSLALEKGKPDMNYYYYECFNDDGSPNCRIYSLNVSLFNTIS